jgi:hypothetical protein
VFKIKRIVAWNKEKPVLGIKNIMLGIFLKPFSEIKKPNDTRGFEIMDFEKTHFFLPKSSPFHLHRWAKGGDTPSFNRIFYFGEPP